MAENQKRELLMDALVAVIERHAEFPGFTEADIKSVLAELIAFAYLAQVKTPAGRQDSRDVAEWQMGIILDSTRFIVDHADAFTDYPPLPTRHKATH